MTVTYIDLIAHNKEQYDMGYKAGLKERNSKLEKSNLNLEDRFHEGYDLGHKHGLRDGKAYKPINTWAAKSIESIFQRLDKIEDKIEVPETEYNLRHAVEELILEMTRYDERLAILEGIRK